MKDQELEADMGTKQRHYGPGLPLELARAECRYHSSASGSRCQYILSTQYSVPVLSASTYSVPVLSANTQRLVPALSHSTSAEWPRLLNKVRK